MKKLLVALALLVSAPVYADADSRSASLDLIRQLLPLEAYNSMLDQMYQQMSNSMKQMGGPALPPEKQEALKAAVKECVPYEELLQWTADVYGRYFTKKEIEDIAAFYKTPTGKKVARMIPTLGGEVGTKMTPILMQRLPAALKKHGIQ